jgi:hypothetical protein
MAAVAIGKAFGWTFYQDAVAASAGATTELVAAVAGKRIRLLHLWGKADVAGAIQLKDGSTARTGAMNLAATGGPQNAGPISPADVNFSCVAQASASAALNLTTVTCVFNGGMIFAVED